MTGFLILIVIILAIVLLSLILNVVNLSGDAKGAESGEVTPSENKTQATLVLVFGLGFLAFVIHQFYKFKDMMLPESASAHGVLTDGLLSISFWIIIPVFFITHLLLIYFAYKYYYRKERKATFYAHSTKLELIWTVVPTLVLTTLIIYGISVWNKIMGPVEEGTAVVELYAKQFDWTARVAGEDNVLGKSHYRKIDGSNVMGIDLTDEHALDDKVIRGELHIPVDKPVLFKMNSRDVIHSAYMPHFRAQMNCVPGMTTQFHYTPTITTAEMRKKTDNPEFDYILLCNKICGSAHYNMQMTIVVDTEEDYIKWLSEKKTVAEELGGEGGDEDSEVTAEVVQPEQEMEEGEAVEAEAPVSEGH